MPNFHIIAGPNGAGKTTFAAEFLPRFAGNCEFINADIIAAKLSPGDPDKAAIQAGRIMLERIRELGPQKVDFAIETTLSGKSYVNSISRLSHSGYSINLYFLWLPDAEYAVKRVADRVRRGGHNIPEATIRRRYEQGISNFFELYAPKVDSWHLINNSVLPRELIARSQSKVLEIEQDLLYNRIRKEVSHERERSR